MTGASDFQPVPPGKIAAVVTYLEMREPPRLARAAPSPQGVGLRRVEQPDTAWFRDLFRRIGADWLWFSRLRLSDEGLAAVIAHSEVEVHALTLNGRDEGCWSWISAPKANAS